MESVSLRRAELTLTHRPLASLAASRWADREGASPALRFHHEERCTVSARALPRPRSFGWTPRLRCAAHDRYHVPGYSGPSIQ
jgi:hypothetical protein